MDTSVGRAKFVRQLYNLRHLLERDEKGEDTEAKIYQLQSKIEKYDKKYHMASFNTKDKKMGTNNTGNKRKRSDRDVSDKDTGGTDCAVLETHGYEVEPQEIVDESGFVIQTFNKVRQLFSTYAPR